jgi:dimethylamine/trimethylamine dehydrogenase
MVLGKRGVRRVHLLDGNRELGGALRWIATLPGLAEWARVIDYRKEQLRLLGNVEVILGQWCDWSDVLEYGANLVVLATGARWASDGLNGFTNEPILGVDANEMGNVATPEQIMIHGKELPGSEVLVYDCDGYFMGTALAEMLAREGKSVTLVTPMTTVAPFTSFTHEDDATIRALDALAVRRITSHVLLSAEAGRLAAAQSDELPYSERVEFAADSVVLVTQRQPEDGLYRQLEMRREEAKAAGIQGIYRIGDCVAPRLIADCVFDGHRLGREIDTADPAIALPFIRENRVFDLANDDQEDRLRVLRLEQARYLGI